ncbi:ribosomal protein, partial [Enterospora canceri]
MPVKRQNHGRSKMNRGSVSTVQCIQCGRVSPKDKSVSRSSNSPVVEAASMDDLRLATVYAEPDVPTFFNIDTYC